MDLFINVNHQRFVIHQIFSDLLLHSDNCEIQMMTLEHYSKISISFWY